MNEKNCEQIKQTIKEELNKQRESLYSNMDDLDTANKGFIFWSSKNTLEHINLLCNRLTRKFANELTDDEITYYKTMSEIINNSKKTWTNIDNMKAVYNQIK